MGGTASYLFAGEEVALVVRPHPIVLFKSLLAPLAAVALVAAVPHMLTAIALLVMLARFSWDVGMWWMDRYVLTSQRIISMSGVFTKKVVSLPLEKITDLTYARSLLGRILGYGSLDLESAGQKDFGRVDFLPDPDHVYRAVMALALGPKPEVIEDSGREPQEPAKRQVVSLAAMNPDRDINNTDEVPAIRLHRDDVPT